MQVRINVTLSTAVCVGDDVVVELVIVAVALHGILSLGQDEFYACFGENGSITTLRLASPFSGWALSMASGSWPAPWKRR